MIFTNIIKSVNSGNLLMVPLSASGAARFRFWEVSYPSSCCPTPGETEQQVPLSASNLKLTPTPDTQRYIPASISLATTWAAPLSLAAMAEAPQPLPRSRTVLPRHTAGLSSRYLQTETTRWDFPLDTNRGCLALGWKMTLTAPDLPASK